MSFAGRTVYVKMLAFCFEPGDRRAETPHTRIETKEEKMATAAARHILVADEAACQKLKEDIEGGVDFADAAKEHSQCPSGARGGDLGTFGRGQMVPEFDQVVFNEALNTVHGPVKTQFGYHLLEITARTE